MITIKEFASLCGCNAQTLRYYDKIDLLKPVQVDRWSGYRYYEKSQAVDFVKIKNLQAADFSIQEIKALLILADQQVYEAFDRKIAEQTEKLERIKEIQQSYLTEMNTMKNLINSFCDQLMETALEPELLREFGLEETAAGRLVDAIRRLMLCSTSESGENARPVNLVIDDTLFEGPEALEKMSFLISEEELDDTIYLNAEHICKDTAELTENLERIWELSGWSYTHEVLDRFPVLKDEEQYVFQVWLHDKGHLQNITYPLLFIAALLVKGYGGSIQLHGFVERSVDGQNHFCLMRRT